MVLGLASWHALVQLLSNNHEDGLSLSFADSRHTGFKMLKIFSFKVQD